MSDYGFKRPELRLFRLYNLLLHDALNLTSDKEAMLIRVLARSHMFKICEEVCSYLWPWIPTIFSKKVCVRSYASKQTMCLSITHRSLRTSLRLLESLTLSQPDQTSTCQDLGTHWYLCERWALLSPSSSSDLSEDTRDKILIEILSLWFLVL